MQSVIAMVTDFLCPRPPLIEFAVPGEAVPFARAGSRGKRRYTLERQADYMQLVKHCAWLAMDGRPPLDGPIAMSVLAEFLHPKSWSRKKQETTYWKETKSDTSNIIKILEDAMNSIVFNDDAQISLLAAQKTYASIARTTVKIWSLNRDD
jgi:Holliday junction resolvase RusA-like endonuclease